MCNNAELIVNYAQMNWDDLRFVLAVADEGSVAAAARVLGVNHATVLRRIAAFETRSGLRLFDRTARGYRISADRTALVEAMREARQGLDRVGQMLMSERPPPLGRLRITSTDTFCARILPPMIEDLARETTQAVDLIAANIHVDFNRLHADVAVRPAARLPQELSGIQAGELHFSVYRRPGGASDWLGFGGTLQRSPVGAWMARQLEHRPAISADSFLTLAALSAEGAGQAVLPCFVGDAFDGLVRVEQPQDLPSVPIWVACHRDMVRSARINRARRFLIERLRDAAPLLRGQN